MTYLIEKQWWENESSTLAKTSGKNTENILPRSNIINNVYLLFLQVKFYIIY